MARPRKQGLDYFPHDCDAVSDEKIELMRAAHGNDGYAFYFILLGRIYRTDSGELDVSATEMLRVLAGKVAVTIEHFNSMLETALKWGLFDADAYNNRHVLTSAGIQRRRQIVIAKREQDRSYYEQNRVSGKVSETKTTTEMAPESTQRKEKKRKEKQPPNPQPLETTAAATQDSLGNVAMVSRDKPALTIKDQLGDIATLFEHNFGALTQLTGDMLKAWVDEYGPDWTRDALTEAVKANVRKPNYVAAILERWQAEGRGPPGGNGHGGKKKDTLEEDLKKWTGR